MTHLALGRHRPVFDLRQQRRLDPDSPVRDFLGIGLRFPNQWLEPGLQILRRCGVKAVVDFAGVDQLFALLPGEIKAVPLVAVEREPGDGKRLPLGTGLFYPIVDTTRNVSAVADLRDDALKASLAGVLVHQSFDGRGLGVAAASYEAVALELTKARPDMLIVAGPDAGRAAQKATQRIPIVALADDLLGSKLVASMPHPEGNTTGVAIFAFQLDVKRLELLHEALPQARRIAVFGDHEPIRNIRDLDNAARGFDVKINPFSARLEEEVIRAIAAMKATPVEAVNLLASPILWGEFRSLIRDRLDLHHLPPFGSGPKELRRAA